MLWAGRQVVGVLVVVVVQGETSWQLMYAVVFVIVVYHSKWYLFGPPPSSRHGEWGVNARVLPKVPVPVACTAPCVIVLPWVVFVNRVPAPPGFEPFLSAPQCPCGSCGPHVHTPPTHTRSSLTRLSSCVCTYTADACLIDMEMPFL